MPGIRGKDMKMFLNTSTTTTPSWKEVVNMKDVTRNLEKTLADGSTRGSNYRQQKGTIKDLSVDFQMVYDPDDAERTAIEDAFYYDLDIDVAFLDGPIDTIGSAGVRFLGQVTKFTGNESLEDFALDDVSIVPTYTGTDLSQAPRRVSVTTSGTITDTAPPTTREGKRAAKQNHHKEAHEPAHAAKAG